MYQVKSQVFNMLTKTQKTSLCYFLRAFVKKNPDVSPTELTKIFIDDEKYYLEQNSPHFEFLADFIEETSFFNDTKKYIDACVFHFEYNKKLEPLKQKQKQFEKERRLFLRDLKRKNEPPTKKQMSYYKSLCDKYRLEETELTSKFDAIEKIESIVNEFKRTNANID